METLVPFLAGLLVKVLTGLAKLINGFCWRVSWEDVGEVGWEGSDRLVRLVWILVSLVGEVGETSQCDLLALTVLPPLLYCSCVPAPSPWSAPPLSLSLSRASHHCPTDHDIAVIASHRTAALVDPPLVTCHTMVDTGVLMTWRMMDTGHWTDTLWTALLSKLASLQHRSRAFESSDPA